MTTEQTPHDKDADALALALGRVLMGHTTMTLHLRALHKALCASAPAIVLADGKDAGPLLAECERMIRCGPHLFADSSADAVLGEARALNKERNAYAHGTWVRAYDDRPHGKGELIGKWTLTPLGNPNLQPKHIRTVQTGHVERIVRRLQQACLGLVWLTFACGPMAQWDDAATGPLANALEGLERWEPAT